MKTIFTLILALFTTVMFAQDAMFVHTATISNSSNNLSYIDHPDLNGNSNAKIVVSHNYNPGNTGFIFNNKSTGVWYDGIQNLWTVFNEDTSNIIIGSSYNVYITPNPTTITYISTSGSWNEAVDHPLLTGNPDANPVLTTYWNPNGIFNNLNYGLLYDDDGNSDDKWVIIAEDFSSSVIPVGSAFFITVGGSDVQSVIHKATSSNIVNNWTIIDNPLLNNNPEAVFVFTHYKRNSVFLDHRTGVWYDGTNWAIYNEDIAAMPVNAEFNLFIFDESLGLNDDTIENSGIYPNPAANILHINANTTIEKITIYNMLGKEILTQKTANTIDISSLVKGVYIVSVLSQNKTTAHKLIKK